MRDLRGHRALVTGASSGIGRELARQLAAMGADLVIAARRRDRLDELRGELEAAHGVTVTCVDVDLARDGATEKLWQAASAAGPIDICVNNAGFGIFQLFSDVPLQRNQEMVRLNVLAVTELSHRFVTAALDRDRRAYLLNVASTASFQPVPYFANYAATKHYVLAFSEALAHELARTQVSVTCLCPGGTWTEFFDTSQQTLGRMARASMLPADKVAAIGLKAMLRGRRSVVTGGMNKLAAWLTRLAPRRMNGAVAARLAGRPSRTLPGRGTGPDRLR